MQKTEQKIRAALVETFTAQGVPLKYEYQLSDTINSALKDSLEAEIDADNVLNFRQLESIRKAAKEKDTIEEARALIKATFADLGEPERIAEALQCLNFNGLSIWRLTEKNKLTPEQRARIEKEKPRANFAYFIDDKKLTLSISLTEWMNDGRMYCSHAREHRAHIDALFKLHFKTETPALLDFLKTEVIGAGCFGSEKDGGLTVRLFKNGRLDIEGLDSAKLRELNDMIERRLNEIGEHVIVFRK